MEVKEGFKVLMLITYDVNTEDPAGKKRLRNVQNSVFECVVDNAMAKRLKHTLENIIDADKDSLRFYNLGSNYKNKVEHIGVKPSIDVDDAFIM